MKTFEYKVEGICGMDREILKDPKREEKYLNDMGSEGYRFLNKVSVKEKDYYYFEKEIIPLDSQYEYIE